MIESLRATAESEALEGKWFHYGVRFVRRVYELGDLCETVV